jgi:hypothetical protein
VFLVHTLAAGLAVYSLVRTVGRGVQQPGAALAFGALIAVGEFARWGGGSRTPADRSTARRGGSGQAPASREAAPLAAAGALAYALLGEIGGQPACHGVLQTVAVTGVAALAGAAVHLARGRALVPDHLARRVLTVAFATTCCQPLRGPDRLEGWLGHGPSGTVLLVLLLALTALCDAVLAAALALARTGRPFGSLLRAELRASRGIGAAVGATGAVIALAVAVAGLWALPVCCVPLLLTQSSVRRHAAARATCRQTVASLARSTEIAGYTAPGHARRVAALSRAVGGELGLSEPELTTLEYAALMHDIGQLSLVDPVPGGATEPLPPAVRRRIARLGGAVVRQTGVPADVAVIVERQADPYPEQPLAARIVRTANAYDDLAGEACGGCPARPLHALEWLRLATARDHEPRVVEALARVLARGGPPAATHG